SFSARSAAVRSRYDSIRNSFPEVVAAHTAAISAPMAPSADTHSARFPNVLSFPHPVKHHVRVGTIPRTNNREFNVRSEERRVGKKYKAQWAGRMRKKK